MAAGDRWVYRFYQIQNGQPGFTSETHLFDLPINTAQFSTRLLDVGTFAGVIQMSDPAVQAALDGQNSLDLLCERTALYVELNGNLVWGGILQQASYKSATKQARIQGQDWWGYFYNNRNITWDSAYTAADQLYVAADLFNSAQGAPYTIGGYTPGFTGVVGGNVGVTLGLTAQGALAGTVTSGIQVTQSWPASSAKPIGQAIKDLGIAANGFDWTIDVAYDANGNPTKTFNLWYPRAGRTFQTQIANGSAVVFNIPGASGQDYDWPTGQDKPANSLVGSGSAASGGSSTQVQESDPSLIQTGWPLLEDNVSFTDVVQQSLLAQTTLAVLNQVKYPRRKPSVQYSAGSDSDQPLGSYAIGDDCRLIIKPDPYFVNGYDSIRGNYGEQWWRAVDVTTTVNDEGKSWQVVSFCTPPILAGQ